MALGGDAVYTLESGPVVFVPRGAPGDVATIALEGTARGVLHGRLDQLEVPGPGRVEPPCPFFRAGCGGCQWQQLQYETQLGQKQELLGETLRRLGKLERVPLLPPLAAPDPWHYRTALQVQVDAEGQVAFAGLRSHDLIPIDACLIAHPLLNRLLTTLNVPLARAILRDRVAAIRSIAARVATSDAQDCLMLLIRTQGGRPRSSRRLVEILRAEIPELASASLLDEPPEGPSRRRRAALLPLHGEPFLAHDVAGRRFYVGPQAFFQVHAAQTERLVQKVREIVAAEQPARLADVYCGVGLFALSVVDLAEQVIGYDGHQEAIALAERALEAQSARQPAVGLGADVRFYHSDVEALQVEDLRGADLVILDPPRSGLASHLIDRLVAVAPSCLIYVSCEPSSLARDLRRLTGAGWSLDSVQVLDMFPQTYHVESVSVLRAHRGP